jgi:phosphatidylserine decarboxylase
MRKPYAAIAVEGYHAIFLTGFAAVIFALLEWWVPAFCFLLFTGFACHFFRDPERVISMRPDIAVSPADGKIIRISRPADPFTGQPRQCVSIFMNVLNVHVNRMPVSGLVSSIVYKPGRFLNASLNKASEDNERCLYSITDNEGNVWGLAQVAGLIARRIVCRVDEGEKVSRGERFGLIKFGSRVDLYLPDNYTPSVMVGDLVQAGHTIIAHKSEVEV